MTQQAKKSLLGWLGSILLAFCGLPELITSIQTGDCSIGWPMLLSWYLGEIFVLIPVIRHIKSPFLIFNYGANTLIITGLILIKAGIIF